MTEITLDQLPAWSEHVATIEGHPHIRVAEARLRYAYASLAQAMRDEKHCDQCYADGELNYAQSQENIQMLVGAYIDFLGEVTEDLWITLHQLSLKLQELAEITLVLAWEKQENTNEN